MCRLFLYLGTFVSTVLAVLYIDSYCFEMKEIFKKTKKKKKTPNRFGRKDKRKIKKK